MDAIKKGEPLHLQSYYLIKNRIVLGDYKPGERLTEVSLSKELGVSRGTIRESLKMLTQDGLTEYENGYLKIIKLDLVMATELYLCRERLESLAAKICAERIEEDEIIELNQIVEETELALSINDIDNIVRLNTDFHHYILEKSMNNELIKIMRILRSKVAFIRNSLHRNFFRQDDYISEHKEICVAISNKNPELAEKAMSKHLQNDLAAMKKIFENNN